MKARAFEVNADLRVESEQTETHASTSLPNLEVASRCGMRENRFLIPPRVTFWLRCIGSVLLFWLVVRKVDWQRLAELLRSADWTLAASASTLVFPLILLLALRWNIFLAQQSIRIPYTRVFLLTWVGQFFNSVLPGSTGGDVFKIYQACRSAPDQKAAAVTSVIIDRVVALVALVLLASFGICNGRPRELAGQLSLVEFSAWWVLIVLFLVAVGAWGGWRYFCQNIARDMIVRLLAPLRLAFRPSRALAFGFVLAMAVHLLTFFSFFLFARALGIGLSFAQILVIVPSILLIALIPVTVNGHGIREVMLVFYFSQFHLSATSVPGASAVDSVIALSALVVTNDFLWSSLGGLAYLLLGRRSRAPDAAPG